jgi:hypothetical protein
VPNLLWDDWLIPVRPIFGDDAWAVARSHNHRGALRATRQMRLVTSVTSGVDMASA